ncbi:MAG: hypothetical protein Q4A30_01350 [Candidatus Saccharibacteria bacterium]|nr:hypothetical protein [Candidatus Saccharibacteria bacterium]
MKPKSTGDWWIFGENEKEDLRVSVNFGKRIWISETNVSSEEEDGL